MRHMSMLEGFQTTGLAGWVIVFVTLVHVVAGLACAVLRVPRVVAIMLLSASLVVPLVIGVGGLYAGRASADRVIRSLIAPTPADIACGERESRYCLVFGLASALLCYAAALPALARSKDPPGDAGAASGSAQAVRS